VLTCAAYFGGFVVDKAGRKVIMTGGAALILFS